MVNLSLVKQNDLWYTVGLIATDGNLSMDKRHIAITSKDYDFLFLLRDKLGLKSKIGLKSRGGSKEKIYGVLQFSDVKFYEFLEQIGLTSRKSLTLKELKIPLQYFSDFLRGVIDGDGNIQETIHTTNRNVQWVLAIVSASPYFLPWIKKQVEASFNLSGKIYASTGDNRNPLYRLKYGKFAAKMILRQCYYEGALTIPRKLKNAKKCIQSSNGLSKYGSFRAS